MCRHNWEVIEGKGYYRKGSREIIVASHITIYRCKKCLEEKYKIHKDNTYSKCFKMDELNESR